MHVLLIFSFVCIGLGQRNTDTSWNSKSVLAETAFSSLSPTYENAEYSPKASHKTYTVTGLTTPPPIFKFSGSVGQFVKMPPWMSKPIINVKSLSELNGNDATPTMSSGSKKSTFSFDFRTSHPTGVLMYLDDGGSRDFLELALHRRRVRLRFKFGNSRSVMLNAGGQLNDRRWHNVRVEIQYPNVKLMVDGNFTTGKASSKYGEFKSFTFLGGIPKTFKLQHLTLPSVYFDPKFRGTIRRFAINNHFVLPIGKTGVIQEAGSSLCIGISNPCRNNGLCVLRANEPSCDCTGTLFTGKNCENSK